MILRVKQSLLCVLQIVCGGLARGWGGGFQPGGGPGPEWERSGQGWGVPARGVGARPRQQRHVQDRPGLTATLGLETITFLPPPVNILCARCC